MSKQNKQRGAVLIELVFTLPFLIFMIMGTIEFSKAISEYKVIVNQVRNAARYLSTKLPTNPSDSYSGIEQAKCIVKTGMPVSICGSDFVLPGLSTVQIDIQNAATHPVTHKAQNTASAGLNGPAINLVTVTVSNYVYQLSFGQSILGSLQVEPAITFSPISATMRQTN